MSKRYLIAPAAERDLRRIGNYLLQNAGSLVAQNVLREVRAGVRRIATNPSQGHRRDDLTSADVWVYTVFSYLIFYCRPKPIRVVRILHASRDAPPILADEFGIG